jgi:hypothetical protein
MRMLRKLGDELERLCQIELSTASAESLLRVYRHAFDLAPGPGFPAPTTRRGTTAKRRRTAGPGHFREGSTKRSESVTCFRNTLSKSNSFRPSIFPDRLEMSPSEDIHEEHPQPLEYVFPAATAAGRPSNPRGSKMKRREILKSSFALAGSLAVGVALAQTKPCPPSPLSVVGGTSATTSCVSAPAGNWTTRSTGAGVIWAHDFTNDNELNYFIRSESPTDANATVTNPTPNVLPNGLRLGATPFGNSRAIISRAVGTRLTAAVPAASDYPTHDTQVWSVASAASLPDPKGQPYRMIVGNGSDSGGIEWIELVSINTSNNTITVRRKMTAENGGYGTNTAPAFPAGFTVGRGPQGSWNRPFAAFPAGQNGRSTPDVGIANHTVTRARTWNTAQNSNAHAAFREGYFGHRSYWDPAVGPATYRNWQPQDPGQPVRSDAWDGDEFYLQFRAKVAASRFSAPTSKMLFIQNAGTSGSGQFFWVVGGSRYGEKPPVAEQVSGVTYGTYLLGLTSYADSAARAGGLLMSPQSDSIDRPSPIQKSYPACRYDSRPNMYCWTFPADRWVTYLIHFKFGKDNAPPDPDDNGPAPNAPWPAATDPTYRTFVEIMVADQGGSTYKTITSDNFVWMFGDGKDSQGYYYYNPPGLNAFWMSQNLNDYVGGGSVSPPSASHQIEYTQVIFSKNFIPVPLD